MENISRLPEQIADLQRQILELDREIAELSEALKMCENQIDKTILTNPELKNEAQRKVEKIEQMHQCRGYIDLSSSLRRQKHQRAELEIDLELMRSRFSIEKMRLKAAMMEAFSFDR
jgi:chromosome segregation ATPase